jgi:hypothetical protein
MSKINKFLLSITKKHIFEIVYSNEYDILNGKKNLQHIINATNIFCDKKNIYVEIGTFRGFTLIHNAIYNKHTRLIGIDNFSLFDKENKNFNFIKNQIKKNNIKNIDFIKKDFEYADTDIKDKIGVLFIDGAHDYRSQLIALLNYSKFMANEGVIIIDDCNYYHVRKATFDFLNSNKEFKLIYQKYTDVHIANASPKKRTEIKNGNWNGINILYKAGDCQINQKLKMPKNEKALIKLFYDTHLYFRHKYAFNVPEILDLIDDFKNQKFSETHFIKKISKITLPKNIRNSIKYKSQNIYK